MRFSTLCVFSGPVLCLSVSAQADIIIDLGGGWEATIFSEQVDLVVDFFDFDKDIIVLQKFANFTEIDRRTGLPAPLSIAFAQIAPDDETVSHIVLTDAFIFNNTGVNWSAFREILLGAHVAFDPEASADFSIDPFTTMTFIDDNTEVIFSDGTVLDGTIWTPGADRGALVINVDLSRDDPVKFVLKELPVPTPGVLALVAGGMLVPHRRRRA